MEHSLSSHYSHPSSSYHDPSRSMHLYGGELPPPHFALSSMNNPTPNMIHGLTFDMWVSAPNKPDRIEEAFHTYTCLQGDQRHPVGPPMPLESLVNWRHSFPRLGDLMADVNTPTNCDIILLETNLKLMDDFPPTGSRLGTQLQLDYSHPTAGDTSMTHEMDNWGCSTYMYEDGQTMLEAHHRISKPACPKIKPPFESIWWAKLFTDLTQEKRVAEREGNHYAADEHARNYFRSLTAVQEIRATPNSSRRLSNPYGAQTGEESQRMAILLFKFRQTRPGETGTTTWRRLIPPPSRVAANSPRTASGIDLPPLSLDALLSRPASSVYHAPQPQDSIQNNVSQPPWLYQPPAENLPNIYSTGSFDFLNAITRPEEGLNDRTAVSSVIDPYPALPPADTSQPSHLNGATSGPMMLQVPDMSLSHSNLGGYGMSHDGHYVPSQSHGVSVPDNQGVLNNLFGSSTQPLDDLSHHHAAWSATPATTLSGDVSNNYSHLSYQPSEHPASVASVSRGSHPGQFEGLMSAEDLGLDRIVGHMPNEQNLNGAGPDHTHQSYADGNTVEAG